MENLSNIAMRDAIVEAFRSYKVNVSVGKVVDAPQMTRYQLIPGENTYKDGTPNGLVTVKQINTPITEVGVLLNTTCNVLVADGAIWLEIPKARREIIKELGGRVGYGMYIPLGLDAWRNIVSIDLSDANTPHLLIAGATGSGKSVALNWIISYITEHYTLDEAMMVLIDLKRVELRPYNRTKNLAVPVITDPQDAIDAIKNMLDVTLERYAEMERLGFQDHSETGWGHVILVIDEFAELIMTTPEIERDLIHIAQIGRACGVHIIMATQDPRREIVTGLIKSNLPARLTFRVTTTAASMVAMDAPDAKNLRGKGDALFTGHGGAPIRLQGPYISREEIHEICARNPYDRGDWPEDDGKKKRVKSGAANTQTPSLEPVDLSWIIIVPFKLLSMILIAIGWVATQIGKLIWWIAKQIWKGIQFVFSKKNGLLPYIVSILFIAFVIVIAVILLGR